MLGGGDDKAKCPVSSMSTLNHYETQEMAVFQKTNKTFESRRLFKIYVSIMSCIIIF